MILEGKTLPYFDAHCDTLSRCLETGESLLNAAGQCNLERLNTYHPFGQIFAIFHDGANPPPEGLLENARRQAALFQREKEQNSELMKQAVLSIEGGELLECDPERLEEARNWGVRSINLTWNRVNLLSGSNIEFPERGLSDRGRAFVRRMLELNIFPDVSHLSDAGFYDLVKMGASPLFASHSNSRVLCPHTRNLTDDQFRLIRDSGGIVGINLYIDFVGGDASMDALLDHFDHFLALDGENTLALGSDWDGDIIGAGNISGVEDMGKLAQAMLQRGYGEKLVYRIFYGNLARFLGFSV